MTCNEFLERTNRGCRQRVFCDGDYKEFCDAVMDAVAAAAERKPFYLEWDAGGVANSYRYATTTARCGVYTTPDRHVVPVVDRTAARKGRASCIYGGGERSYLKWFREVSDGKSQSIY